MLLLLPKSLRTLVLLPPPVLLLLRPVLLLLQPPVVLLPQPLRTLVLLRVLQRCCAQAGALQGHHP